MRSYVPRLIGVIATIFLLVASCTQDLPDVPKYEVQSCEFSNGSCARINSQADEDFCKEMNGTVVEGACVPQAGAM